MKPGRNAVSVLLLILSCWAILLRHTECKRLLPTNRATSSGAVGGSFRRWISKDVLGRAGRLFHNALRLQVEIPWARSFPKLWGTATTKSSSGSGAYRGTIPPMVLFLLSSSPCSASALNKQRIAIRSPFFQGWLVRVTDHEKELSFIFIVGSFSARGDESYSEHYVFCGLNFPGVEKQISAFPPPETVNIISSGYDSDSIADTSHTVNAATTDRTATIATSTESSTKAPPSNRFAALRERLSYLFHPHKSTNNNNHDSNLNSNKKHVPLDIVWKAEGLGQFSFSEKQCTANFRFPHELDLAFHASSRMPWASTGKNTENTEILDRSAQTNQFSSSAAAEGGKGEGEGPEGWLSAVPFLLPCHYFVHSVGSHCSYSLRLLDKKLVDSSVSVSPQDTTTITTPASNAPAKDIISSPMNETTAEFSNNRNDANRNQSEQLDSAAGALDAEGDGNTTTTTTTTNTTNTTPSHIKSSATTTITTTTPAINTTTTTATVVSGEGFAHIEGNHGQFFPEGWTWAQAINNDNKASFSLAGGKFVIAGLAPLNFILFLRRRNGCRAVFRTTDLAKIGYLLDSSRGHVQISAETSSLAWCMELRSFAKLHRKLTIDIQSELPVGLAFGKPVHIPTFTGFSDSPGCRETYTAVAVLKYREWFEYTDDRRETAEQISNSRNYNNSNNNNNNNNNNVYNNNNSNNSNNNNTGNNNSGSSIEGEKEREKKRLGFTGWPWGINKHMGLNNKNQNKNQMKSHMKSSDTESSRSSTKTSGNSTEMTQKNPKRKKSRLFVVEEDYEFPLTALEFGGSFTSQILRGGNL